MRVAHLLLQRGSRELDVCVEDETMGYLNRKDVQEAMHARLEGGVPKWTVCSRCIFPQTFISNPQYAALLLLHFSKLTQ